MLQQLMTQPTTLRLADEVEGVGIRLDTSLDWMEWRTWLRPLLDEGGLRHYGIDLERTHSIAVIGVSDLVPRVSGMIDHDRAQLHYLLACEMQHGFGMVLPITIVRELDMGRLLSDCGADEAGPYLSVADFRIWKPQFQVIVHYTVGEFVKHFNFLIDERESLHRHLEARLPEGLFHRICPALEYRN